MRHIWKDYYLDQDKWNYILVQRGIREKGKNEGSEYYETIGYFGTNLRMLFVRLVQLRTKEHIVNDNFKQLLGEIEQIQDVMKEMLSDE